MNDKDFRSLKRIHNALALGCFLLFVISATIIFGFPNGFLGGLIFGALFALIMRLCLWINDSILAQINEKLLAYSLGQDDAFTPSKKAIYAILGILVVCGLACLLEISGELFPGSNNIITAIIFILIGFAVASETLFRQGRVKRRAATLSLISLAAIVILLVVKMLFFR